jgi:hypothetical protein
MSFEGKPTALLKDKKKTKKTQKKYWHVSWWEKFAKKLLGKTEVEAVLQKLDRLTQDEARMAVTQTLGVVHGLVGNVRLVMEGTQCSYDRIAGI